VGYGARTFEPFFGLQFELLLLLLLLLLLGRAAVGQGLG
jgi:hypothetical protein